MRKNASVLGIRPDLIYMYGFSAGAVCSIQSAYLQQDEVSPLIDTVLLGSLANAGGNVGYSNHIRGIISNAGGIGDTNWIKGPEQVAVASIHNTTDPTVPYKFGPSPFPGINIFGGHSIDQRLKHLGIKTSLHSTNSAQMHLPGLGNPYVDTFFVNSINALSRMVCVDVNTGITKLEHPQDDKIGFYPNPAENNIQFTGLRGSTLLRLYNTTGKLMLETVVSPTTTLDLSEISSGMYYAIFDGQPPIKLQKIGWH
jgi:hypothetical protein